MYKNVPNPVKPQDFFFTCKKKSATRKSFGFSFGLERVPYGREDCLSDFRKLKRELCGIVDDEAGGNLFVGCYLWKS